MNKYYRFLAVIIVAVNLSVYLFNGTLHAEGRDNRIYSPYMRDVRVKCFESLTTTNEGVLTTIVPSILQPVGNLGTEIRDTSTIERLGRNGVMKGVFSFSIDQQRKEIEIEYKFDDEGNVNHFPPEVGPHFLKEILDNIPAVFLSEVNKITVLITEDELPSSLFRRLSHRTPSNNIRYGNYRCAYQFSKKREASCGW